MSIIYDEEKKIFKLDTRLSSYIMAVTEGNLGQVYYGRKINDIYPGDLLRLKELPLTPGVNAREEAAFNDSYPFEYPAEGRSDFRENALAVETEDGFEICDLKYDTYRIYDGKKPVEGMPALFGKEWEITTAEIDLSDSKTGIKVTLFYSVFEELDVIVRRVRITNTGTGKLIIKRAMSASVSLDGDGYDVITLHGAWGRERRVQRRPIDIGTYVCSSKRGETSHQDNCFMGICGHDATEDHGEVYGLNLVYSGNFAATAELSQFERSRFMMGINPERFSWALLSGESFDTPECVCVFSGEGIGGMSRRFHDLYRKHLIRSRFVDRDRPVLINNWEATYFDFNSEKLLSIAKQAKECGIEMLVMDDGWFGHRNNDDSSLGDWYVNEDKIQGGLKKLVDDVNAIGMKFGIWMEPEMISPDSKLYEAHPDWVIRTKTHEPLLSRCQLVLDISKEEVKEYAWKCVKDTLSSANIEYLKWDMNRQLSDIPDGEISHKYVLALYELQERLVNEFPELLFENCSGGGARFDPGMLYYSPQIWCSDDMDPVERLSIQRGTAICYPLSTMGAHVCSSPNHTTGRVTPFETRGIVALAGTFGYELDVTKISAEEKELIKKQIDMYHRYSMLVRNGDYYRLASVDDNGYYDAYMVVSKDKKEALLTYVQVRARANYKSRRVFFKGLDEDMVYEFAEGYEGASPLHGATLMNAGINIEPIPGDIQARLIYIKSVSGGLFKDILTGLMGA